MIDAKWIEEVKKDLPELPDQKKSRYIETLGLSVYDAEVLMLDRDVSVFFDACIKLGADAKKVSNWIATDVLGKLKAQNISITQTKLSAENLAKMVKLIDAGTISGKIAKDLLPKMIESGTDVEKLISEGGMTQISDEGEIQKLIQSVLDKNAGQVEQYKAGKQALFGFFVGQVMKESKGRAKPDSVNQILKKLLG
jgi:aspartyl-tRNA(Asn)/glutamyl-tRNA(Gln) amidotransferase subunit B